MAEVAYVLCQGWGRKIIIKRGPMLRVKDPKDLQKVHLQVRCKCGLYDMYPYREVKVEERQTLH